MSSHKILVVEYREDLRNVVASFLCSQGYEVIEAGDGQEAIKAAISLDPEFILLNLHLPDIDGEEVARALHEIPAIANIRIVGWSAASKPSQEALQWAGCLDYLQQPVSLTMLEEVIKRYVHAA